MKTYEVWYAIPSASMIRAGACLHKWRRRGFRTAVMIDPGTVVDHTNLADRVICVDPYPGYWQASVMLCRDVLDTADIVVCGGDDIYPDPDANPQRIAAEFYERFPDGFGVMQPTGDDLDGTDRICGSPWFGKAWIEEAYDRNGPFWPGYEAFFGDEDLFNVAKMLGVLWQRPDLTQFHDHWIRPGGPKKTDYQIRNDRFWEYDQKLFNERKAAGFPHHQRRGA